MDSSGKGLNLKSFRLNVGSFTVIVIGAILVISLSTLLYSNFVIFPSISYENKRNEFAQIGKEIFERASRTVEGSIQALEGLSFSPDLMQVIETSNAEYDTLSYTEVGELVNSLDQAWMNKDPAAQELINQIYDNPVSDHIRQFLDEFPEEVEIFITDKYGRIVAMSNLTSDYWQGDEEWWLGAYADGEGKTYISPVDFDESTGTYAINIGVPVRDKQREIIGILRGTVNITVVFDDLQGIQFGQTGSAALVDQKGTILYAKDHTKLYQSANQAYLPFLQAEENQIQQGMDDLDGNKAIVAFFMPETEILDSLNWVLILDQDIAEINDQIYSRILPVFWGEALLILVFMVFVYRLINRMVQPIRIITRALQKLQNGNLHQYLPDGTYNGAPSPGDQAVSATAETQTFRGSEIPRTGVEELDQLSSTFESMDRNLKSTLETLHISEERYRTMVQNMPIGIFRTSIGGGGKFVTYNNAFMEIIGAESPEEVDKLFVIDLYVNIEDRAELIEEIITLGLVQNKELVFNRIDGTTFWASITSSVVKTDDGEILYIDSTVQNISDRKAYEEQLQYLATHDTLTGLPNRALLEDRLGQALNKASRSNTMVGVLFMDLDGFKAVNDAYGHKEGDKLLIKAGKRLNKVIRKSDTVARFGGDEFAIILEELDSLEDLLVAAEKALSVFSKPFKINQAEIFITASLGISVFPDDSDKVEVLLQNADTAMYRAKANPKDSYQFYSRYMKEEVRTRFELITELREALRNNEFEIYYQPQVNALSRQIIGAEALIRWNHPEKGLVSPGQFIPLAEETGMIVEMGEWVLSTACRQFRQWQKQGLPRFRLSVNLSEKELNRDGLVDMIRSTLRKTETRPDCIELELTENIVFQNFSKSQALLKEIKKIGVNLAVDDFGTGYSTLSQLAHFNFDTLKIDQRFAPSVTKSESDAAIVSGIITIAKNLKMNIIAEGIEEKSQLDFFLQKGCENIQGYYFSKPVPVAGLEEMLRNGIFDSEKD